MKRLRSCPICSKCGSKKFERMAGSEVKVRCVNCKKIISI